MSNDHSIDQHDAFVDRLVDVSFERGLAAMERYSMRSRPQRAAPDGIDSALERAAKRNPDIAFHLLVGDTVLGEAGSRSSKMKLDSDAAYAALGLHLAEGFDKYADNHHIKRLPGVPSRRKSIEDMARGEAFWAGYQSAKGVAISGDGERRNLSDRERRALMHKAMIADRSVARQGHDFATNGRETAYQLEVRKMMSAIARGDDGHFIPSRRAVPAKARTAGRQLEL